MNSIKAIKGDFFHKSIVSLDQFDTDSLALLFDTVNKIKDAAEVNPYLELLRGNLAALLFFEPSSRTFSSFAAAVKKLGGQTIEYQNPTQTSSAVKGETIEDTMQVFANYAEVIIMRHPAAGTLKVAAQASPVPVINAGDGIGEHPTQGLMDMLTIYERFGRLDTLTGMVVGDLLNGRTVHSLMKGLSMYKDNTLYLLSPENLKISRELYKKLSTQIKIIEISSDKDIPTDCHFWYWTRVQKERFTDYKEYDRLKHAYILTPQLIKNRAAKQTIFLHPLPRVGEIETRVDTDPRALYLTTQMKNGLYVRMALLSLVLGKLR
jgi:aspartate carbamoyltransferase